MTAYQSAADVEAIAQGLIPKHHPHLERAPIAYVFRDKATSSKGRLQLGKARRVSGLASFLARRPEPMRPDTLADFAMADNAEPFLVLEIARDAWELMPAEARTALVDHELCHFSIDDRGGWTIKPHDVEEFTAVVERHGAWQRAVFDLLHAGLQHVSAGGAPPADLTPDTEASNVVVVTFGPTGGGDDNAAR